MPLGAVGPAQRHDRELQRNALAVLALFRDCQHIALVLATLPRAHHLLVALPVSLAERFRDNQIQ
jgi:hypothetical protein